MQTKTEIIEALYSNKISHVEAFERLSEIQQRIDAERFPKQQPQPEPVDEVPEVYNGTPWNQQAGVRL